jgi:hypothetical protein
MGGLISRRKDIKWGTSSQSAEQNPNFTGGKYIDDKGYIRVLRPEHPYHNHGYIYEHRLVMEAFFGRFLEPWESVHHINEVKVDNRLENLFLTTRNEHAALHAEGKMLSLERRAALRNKVREKRRLEGPQKRDATGKFVKADGDVVK